MVMFSQVLSGPKAAEVGLAWECVPDDQLLAKAQEYASVAAHSPKELVARAKATIEATQAIDSSMAAMELELEPQAWSMVQDEFTDFVTALKAKISSS